MTLGTHSCLSPDSTPRTSSLCVVAFPAVNPEQDYVPRPMSHPREPPNLGGGGVVSETLSLDPTPPGRPSKWGGQLGFPSSWPHLRPKSKTYIQNLASANFYSSGSSLSAGEIRTFYMMAKSAILQNLCRRVSKSRGGGPGRLIPGPLPHERKSLGSMPRAPNSRFGTPETALQNHQHGLQPACSWAPWEHPIRPISSRHRMRG